MTLTPKRLHEATTVTGAWYDKYMALDKSGDTAMSKISVADIMMGVKNAASYGASPSASAATNVAAIQAAIDAAAATTPAGAVVLPGGEYEINGPLTIATNGVRFGGEGGDMRAWLKCTDATAGLVIDKGGGSITYQVRLHDLGILGESIATTGLSMVNANECALDNVYIGQCATGLSLSGAFTGINKIDRLTTNNCTTAVNVDDASSCWFRSCNLYDSGTVFNVAGTVFNIVVRDSWIETFDTGVLFDSAAGALTCYSMQLHNNYWLSTNGGGTYDCRIVKSTCSSANNNVVRGLQFIGNHIYTTAAKYAVEVAWGGNYGNGDNRFFGSLRDNFLHAATNMTAWLTSDATDLTFAWVWLGFTGNGGAVTVKPRDAANLTCGLEKFSAGDATPSVASQAPIYKTANTSSTTITAFDDGIDGQVIRVLIADAVTTVDFTASNLKGNGGADWTPGSGDWMEAIFDGTNWYCAVHDCTA